MGKELSNCVVVSYVVLDSSLFHIWFRGEDTIDQRNLPSSCLATLFTTIPAASIYSRLGLSEVFSMPAITM